MIFHGTSRPCRVPVSHAVLPSNEDLHIAAGGGLGRVDDQHRRVPGPVIGGGLHAGYPRDGGEPVIERRDHSAVLCSAGQLGDHDQRPVEPRSQPFEMRSLSAPGCT